MNKLISSTLVITALATCVSTALAQSETAIADKYFNKSNAPLAPNEKAALDLAKRWNKGAPTNMAPIVAMDGAIQFTYGLHQPTIVCAPLQICDLAIQAGEVINSLHIGDNTRWTIDPAITGSGSNEVIHLIIKPMDVGLDTSLVITTNRRTYHLKLKSHRSEYMAKVRFAYPEEAQAKFDIMRMREEKERNDRTIPSTGEYLGDLSFSYEISGSAPWKPVRVFNDGRKTIIEMPKAMSQTEAPALLLVRKEGGLFSDDETTIVNYRLQGQRFIVDAVFDKAILIAGVGSSQDKITITRGK